jgi:hypothetical protein
MMLHPRTPIVDAARSDFAVFWIEFRKKHNLTYAEFIAILANEVSSLAMYAIRFERHPDNDKRGDEA